MKNTNLIDNLGGRGEKLLSNNLHNEETIAIKLKGSNGEALVMSNKRLYVLKWGYFTGSLFGGRCLGFEFDDITAIEIKTGLIFGTVEVLTPATQNAQRSVWSTGQNNATTSDNVVTFTRELFNSFREAVNIVREKINNSRQKGTTNYRDINDLEKLALLRDKKVITSAEFEAKKKQILSL